ncbi:cohesin subunit SA-3 [Pelodytes ibericus]
MTDLPRHASNQHGAGEQPIASLYNVARRLAVESLRAGGTSVLGILLSFPPAMPVQRSSRPSGLAAVSSSITPSSSSDISPHSMRSPSSEGSLHIDSERSPNVTYRSSSPEMPMRITRSHSSSVQSNGQPPLRGGGGEVPTTGANMTTPRDLSTEEDMDLSDSGSDFEETLKKRPRHNHRPSPRGTVVSKRPRRAIANETTEGDLFEAIKQGKSAMQILVDDWMDSYKKNHESGLLEIINFLMQACGCKGVVTREMLSMQNPDIIRKMTEEFDEDTADYPLSLTTQAWKKFRLNLGEFLETLVSRSQYSIIYDEILMDALISLLTGLSDSQVRAFRHTSSFAAMKLMTGLVKVARDLSTHIETCQRQYDVERAKIPEKRAPERLETLLQKRKDLHDNLEEIGNMMNGIFKGVFVHRYRDIVPDIRAFCIEELGNWMKTHSQSFLNDSYLKYVGWTLHDKQGYVRLQCVRTLQALYSLQDMAGRLELFTGRFKDRMVSMVLDKEQQVAVEAIKLLGLISENMENMLSKEDCETVYPLVFASNRAVSSAAGAFLCKRLLDIKATPLSPRDRSRRESHAAFFRLLVSFFIESELHEHAAYLVDSLWESARPQLRDWECQTDLLLLEEEGMDDRQESALIEISVSAIRQAVEGTSPVGRVPSKKVLSAKDRKLQSEDKSKLTRHMIVTLPHLLAKFSADAEKMTSLLSVTGFLELEVYYTERLEKHLDLLLLQVRDILEKHTAPEVLEACSRALYVLCDREQTVYKNADITRSHLVDQLTDYFSQQISDILQVSDLDEDEVYNIAATMKRISALYSGHDLSRWELFDPCTRILRKGIDTGEVPEQILLPALTCCYFSLLWDLYRLSSSKPMQDSLAALRQRLGLFCEMCQCCLSDHHSAVREQAFILLSDLLVIFGSHMTSGERSHLQPLVYHPELSLQAEMAGFLVDHVFADPDDGDGGDEAQQITLLHNRRNLLAGYCKLIIYNGLQLRSASDIFRHYMKFYTDYGDIIKEMLHKSRTINKEESTRTLLLSLTQAYTALCLEANTPPRRSSRVFLDIRDLARRFALLFGPDQLRNRQDIVLMHKEGITFSLLSSSGAEWSPQNLPFLDVLSEFSPKLLRQDKKALLQYLDQICQQCTALQQLDEGDGLRAPLQAYKKSLRVDGDASPSTPSRAGAHRDRVRSRAQGSDVLPASKKRRTRSKGALEEFSVMTEEGGQKHPPLMTSTVLKERNASGGLNKEKEDESAGSEADFEPSPSLIVRRYLGTPVSSHRMGPRTESRGTLSSSLHRLSLIEDEEDVIVIEEAESSSGSLGEEEWRLQYVGYLEKRWLRYMGYLEERRLGYLGYLEERRLRYVGYLEERRLGYVGYLEERRLRYLGYLEERWLRYMGYLEEKRLRYVGYLEERRLGYVGYLEERRLGYVGYLEELRYVGYLEERRLGYVGYLEERRLGYVGYLEERRLRYVGYLEERWLWYVGYLEERWLRYMGYLEEKRLRYVGYLEERRLGYVGYLEERRLRYVGYLEERRLRYVGYIEGRRLRFVGYLEERLLRHVVYLEEKLLGDVGYLEERIARLLDLLDSAILDS